MKMTKNRDVDINPRLSRNELLLRVTDFNRACHICIFDLGWTVPLSTSEVISHWCLSSSSLFWFCQVQVMWLESTLLQLLLWIQLNAFEESHSNNVLNVPICSGRDKKICSDDLVRLIHTNWCHVHVIVELLLLPAPTFKWCSHQNPSRN